MFNIFKKPSSKQKQIGNSKILSATEVAQVSGGLNPQPLPPRAPNPRASNSF